MSEFIVLDCARRLGPYIVRTPLAESEVLSEAAGTKVYLKLETLQRTGAFKFRGAMNYLLSLSEAERAKGVVTASSGNHGLGMSLGSRMLGTKCTVVMPRVSPSVKQERARRYGAEVVLHGDTYDEAACHAETLARAKGCPYVPSFNHPAIMEGQGTILEEILSDLPQAGSVIAPIGGGGLIAGLLMARRELKPGLPIIGAEPVGAAAMKSSVDAGKLVTLDAVNTIADGVAVKTVGDLTFEVVLRERPHISLVTDEEIVRAQTLLLTGLKLIAEPAGAVSVAAALGLAKEHRTENTVCIVTGSNIDTDRIHELLHAARGTRAIGGRPRPGDA